MAKKTAADAAGRKDRIAEITRTTKETDIRVRLNLDGTGICRADTGVGFFDHMLDGFARHGLFDLDVTCRGDISVDSHHTIEDVGIVLGTAIREALGDKAGNASAAWSFPWTRR